MTNNGCISCIDAGREGCPCALAEYGNCLVCGRLSGKSCEECAWQGSCIYTLFQQNGRKVVAGRRERLFAIDEVRDYGPGCRVFVVRADRGFCQKAQTAGAFVFAKDAEAEAWFGMPVSILKSEPDRGRIHLGVCSCGPKSARLLQTRVSLSLRGIYYNALSGMGSLKENRPAVIFGKGIAMAPLRNFLDGGSRYTKWLKEMEFYADLDKVGFDFFRDYFGDLPAESVHVRSFAREGLCSLDKLDYIEENDLNVFALTSPFYADQVQRAAGQKVVRPAEGNMCCGEGICGACTFDNAQGRTIHRCKVSL